MHVLANVAPTDVAIEGLRSLRTAFRFGVLKPRNKVIMITGPRPGVGKSFTSTNFAAVLAAGGERVVLVDADMRRGNVNGVFALPRKSGLSECLRGEKLDEVIQRNVQPNLDVLTGGSIPDLPSELLMHERFVQLLGELQTRYDRVIIDFPPVLAVADAGLIGRHVGATLLVVRHGRHTAAELAEATRQLASAGVQLDGALLTDALARAASIGAFSDYGRRGD